jgi:prevent-host-death family protein
MNNPLKVSLENIIPLTEARDHFSQIVAEVQKDKLYVLTKGGKPAVAIIDVKYLETLTGGEIKETQIEKEIEKAPEKVGLPPMVEHLTPIPAKAAVPPPPKPPEPAKPQTPPPMPPPPKPISPPLPASQPPKPAPNPASLGNQSSDGQLKTPKIDINIMDDSDQVEKAAQEDKKQISGGSEDEAGPAQYAGDTTPKNEPDDMVID